MGSDASGSNSSIKEKINPMPGLPVNIDGIYGVIITVAGGRTIVDFNHPLAGKNVVYEINILRKVDDLNEKIKSLLAFFFRREFNFSVEGNKIIIEVEKKFSKFMELFKDKFKEVLDMEFEIKELEAKEKIN